MTRCLLVICHRRLGYSFWDHPDDIGNNLSRNVGDYQPTQRHSPEDVSTHQQHYKNIKRHSYAIWFIVCPYGPSLSRVNINNSIIAWNWVEKWSKLNRWTVWFYMRSLCLGKRLRRVGHMPRTRRQGTPILFWLKSLLVWHNFEHYPGSYLEELRQTTKNVINWSVSASRFELGTAKQNASCWITICLSRLITVEYSSTFIPQF